MDFLGHRGEEMRLRRDDQRQADGVDLVKKMQTALAPDISHLTMMQRPETERCCGSMSWIRGGNY